MSGLARALTRSLARKMTRTATSGEGVPGWMAGMDWGVDYVRNARYGAYADPTVTAASTRYMLNSQGIYVPIAANTLARQDGVGAQVVPTRAQLISNPVNFGHADWKVFAGAAKVGPAAIPDIFGGTNAYEVSFGSTGGAIASASAFYNTNTGTLAATTVYGTVWWVRAKSGTTTVRVSIKEPNSPPTGTADITVTDTAWTAIPYTTTTGGTPGSGNIAIRNNLAGNSGNVYVCCANLYAGSLVVPPIDSVATVSGDQVVYDLTGRLGSGVGGIIQFTPLALDSSTSRVVFDLNDGSVSNRFVIYTQSGNYRHAIGKAGVYDVTEPTIGAATAGSRVTMIFAVSSGYRNARIVGQADPGADLSTDFPAMSKMSILGQGYSAGNNSYGYMHRIAVAFRGGWDDASFAALYPKGQLMAAA